MPLPARVRLSRLSEPPGEALLGRLRQLAPQTPLERLRDLPAADLICLLAVAGGRVVGVLLAEREGERWAQTLVLEAAWRGRGVEDALRAELTSLL